MSRQIQIRRGTTTENENFTGVIGEITMDTDKKTLRIHDGETAGGIELARADAISEVELPENMDYVIASQLPTSANNYTWYRKYKSGWVEQGGVINNSPTNSTITFNISMLNSNYSVLIGKCQNNSGGVNDGIPTILTRTATTLSLDQRMAAGLNAFWQVKGMASA